MADSPGGGTTCMSRQAVKFIEKCSMQPSVRSGNGFEPRLQKKRGSVIRFCAVLIKLSDEISVIYESTATPSRYPSQPKQDHNSHLSEFRKALKKDYNCFISQVFSSPSERRQILSSHNYQILSVSSVLPNGNCFQSKNIKNERCYT